MIENEDGLTLDAWCAAHESSGNPDPSCPVDKNENNYLLAAALLVAVTAVILVLYVRRRSKAKRKTRPKKI